MKLNALGAALLLGCATLSQAQEAPKPPPQEAPPKPTFTFALKGFVSMTAAYQSGAFGLSEGQQSLESTTGVSPVPDKNSTTFDVRQSRFNFSVQGPKVLNGATPTGVLEIDFFQGFGPGRYGDVSLLNRLRLAYSELNWGAHRLLFGQNNDLVFAMAPMSLSHIAFPLGYYTGNIGWRRPGIFGYHTIALPSDLKLEGAWEVGRSQWADLGGGAGVPATGIGAGSTGDPGGISLGEASAAPALEGRVTLGYSKLLSVFVAAHWNQVDLTGYGNGNAVAAGAKHSVNTVAYNAGLKFTMPLPTDMLLTVQGTGFTGQNVAPLIANLTTGAPAFRVGPLGQDVSTMGWWAQAGFNFTKELSLWAFYGSQAIDKADFVRAGIGTAAAPAAYENATTNIQAVYRDGNYGFSVEWINFATKYNTTVNAATETITGNRTAKSDQYMFTANYFF